MMVPAELVRKSFFIFMAIVTATLLLCVDQSMGAEDIAVVVDKSSLFKGIGLAALGVLGEIWRNQRSIYKIINGHGEKINKIEGYCKGKNMRCGPDDDNAA